MNKNKILLIDDNAKFRNDVELLLKSRFEITKAENATKGLAILKKENFSVLLLDLKLPDIYGIDVLKRVHNEIPDMPVIIVTDLGEIDIAVEAMKSGAYDFFQKDFNIEMLVQKINSAFERKDLISAVRSFQQDQLSSDSFIFKSEIMERINYEIERVAMNDADVLILGESGTGKDLVASEIHKRSKRKGKLFVSVPIASLSENLIESELFGHVKGAFSGAEEERIGKFEGANNGTVYLPEISDLSQYIQIKLLQFLQYKTISRVGSGGKKNNEIQLNVRVIIASNDNLQELVRLGKMREDFYYRISATVINMPPLRERVEDIEPLTEYFLRKYERENNKNKKFSVTGDVIKKFKSHRWQGNVRELENAIRNAFVFNDGPVFDESSFLLNEDNDRAENIYNLPMNEAEVQFRKKYIQNLLSKMDGNRTKAAEAAGLSRQGLQKILKELGIE